MTQREIIDELLWQQASADALFMMPREEYLAAMHEYDLEAIDHEGEPWIAFLHKGPEFHFSTLQRRPISMKLARAMVQPIIDKHGYATTKTPKEDERQQRFNALFGFDKIGEDEFFIHYRIERIRGRH